jgi:hypothetical protein
MPRLICKKRRELFAVWWLFAESSKHTAFVSIIKHERLKKKLKRAVKRRPTHDHGRSSMPCVFWILFGCVAILFALA